MSILDRDSLEQSSLADLHAIASELSIDSFRRLRKAQLIDVILERQAPSGGDSEEPVMEADELAAAVEEELRGRDEDARPRRRRLRRGRRKDNEEPERSPGEDEEPAPDHASSEDAVEDEPAASDDEPGGRRNGERAGSDTGRRPAGRREGGRREARGREAGDGEAPDREAGRVEGVIEVLPGGSGFVRVAPPDPSDDDVYVSGAQVRRFELVSGDRVGGPRRPPRRSERFASLVRVESVNGQPVSELEDTVPFEEQPVGWPSQPLELEASDPTVAAVLSVVPLGRGSRITIAGPTQSGKTETIRRLAAALRSGPEVDVQVVLCGVRPEEIADWRSGPLTPTVASTIGVAPDVRAQAVDAAVEQARRLAVRGGHAIVLIDTLDGLDDQVKRKALAAARNLVDGGSVTVVATGSNPVGGETGVVGLSALLAAAGRWPAIDPARSWTMRPELLVGEARADEIGRARAQALDR